MTDTIQTAPKRFQCRHIHTEGRRCGSACLRGEEFCYFHHTSRKPVTNPRARRSRQAAFDLSLPEDRGAIQLSIGEVLRRIASNAIDPRRAGLLLYGLQIAALNLPPHKPANTRREGESPVVEEIVTDPTHGAVAPPFELPDPDAPVRDTLTGRLLAALSRGQEEIDRECRARFEAELQSGSAPIPEPLPQPQRELPTETKPQPELPTEANLQPEPATLLALNAAAEATAPGAPFMTSLTVMGGIRATNFRALRAASMPVSSRWVGFTGYAPAQIREHRIIALPTAPGITGVSRSPAPAPASSPASPP